MPLGGPQLRLIDEARFNPCPASHLHSAHRRDSTAAVLRPLPTAKLLWPLLSCLRQAIGSQECVRGARSHNDKQR